MSTQSHIVNILNLQKYLMFLALHNSSFQTDWWSKHIYEDWENYRNLETGVMIILNTNSKQYLNFNK